MPIPLPKIIPDAEPGGPVVAAMNRINALTKLRLENKYYGPNIESEINNRNALTEGQKITNEFLPDKLRLANALAGLQNQYYAPNMQSEINHRNSLTQQLNAMTPLEAEALRLKNQYYPQVTQSQIAADEALAKFRSLGGAGMGVGQKEMIGLQNQLAREHPDWSPEVSNQAASAYISGESALPDGTLLPELSGLAQSYVDQIVKRGSTAMGLNQQRFAATTDAIIEQGKPLIPSVAKYAGVLGKAKGNIDAAFSSLGADSPDYKEYLYFTRQFVPYAAGEMMRALGVNASDTQKVLYQQVINPISWDSNPKTALENYNRMTQLFKETVSKTVSKSAGQIRASLKGTNSRGDYKAPPAGTIGMYKKGELYYIPPNKVDEALAEGFTYE